MLSDFVSPKGEGKDKVAVWQEQREVVLTRVLAGKLALEEAALLLQCSERQVWRLKSRLLDGGAAALVHGNRGKVPANKVDPALARRVVAFAQDGYAGINDTHLSELLAEREDIHLSRASVQRILRGAGIPSPRRHRAARYRSRRERRAAEGMLLQLDGSREDWFGSGDRVTLQTIVDDATGNVLAAVFREQEDGAGYFELLRTVLSTRGVPLALYSDRHGIFFRSPREREALQEELVGERQPTQFGRALAELGIELILANSPQAKGRVERLFGTFQDRLVAELRLERMTSIDEGNRFLPRYLPRHNARFGILPADATAAWRPLPAGKSIESVCCFKYSRLVASDNTVRLDGAVLQLPPLGVRGSWAHQRVELRQYLDGSFSAHAPGGRELARSAVPSTPPKLRARNYVRAPIAGIQPLPKPKDHPWRKWQPGAFRQKPKMPRDDIA